MDIGPVPFNTPQPHRGHGAVVLVAAIRPEPEADRKVLSLTIFLTASGNFAPYYLANALTAAAACSLSSAL